MSSKHVWATLVAGGLWAATATAQVPPEPLTDKLFVVENFPPLAAMGAKIDIIGSEGGAPGPVITGKPYSARSITESTQMLADGNRITQRNEAVVYRDTEGRTRREQTLNSVGPWQAGEPVTMINIHDPVAGKSYVLDATSKTAREIRPFQVAIAQAPEGIAAANTDLRATWNVAVPAPPPAPGLGFGVERDVTVMRRDVGGRESVRVFAAGPGAPVTAGTMGMREAGEDIGEQVLEGLLVQGTRFADVIPAGTIGNERPIEIVTERWYSKDIDAIVLHRFSDPRFGETSYRLVNVVRGEPSADLFQVPQGFEVKAAELPRPGVHVLPGAPGQLIEFGVQRAAPAPQE